MDGWIDVWIDVWMKDGCMDGWMDRCMDRWMDGWSANCSPLNHCLYSSMYVFVCLSVPCFFSRINVPGRNKFRTNARIYAYFVLILLFHIYQD